MDLSKIPEPSDEIWWARRRMHCVDIYATKESARSGRASGSIFTDVSIDTWTRMGGPDMRKGEIIPIRPLRIEKVKVMKDG